MQQSIVITFSYVVFPDCMVDKYMSSPVGIEQVQAHFIGCLTFHYLCMNVCARVCGGKHRFSHGVSGTRTGCQLIRHSYMEF